MRWVRPLRLPYQLLPIVVRVRRPGGRRTCASQMMDSTRGYDEAVDLERVNYSGHGPGYFYSPSSGP